MLDYETAQQKLDELTAIDQLRAERGLIAGPPRLLAMLSALERARAVKIAEAMRLERDRTRYAVVAPRSVPAYRFGDDEETAEDRFAIDDAVGGIVNMRGDNAGA